MLFQVHIIMQDFLHFYLDFFLHFYSTINKNEQSVNLTSDKLEIIYDTEENNDVVTGNVGENESTNSYNNNQGIVSDSNINNSNGEIECKFNDYSKLRIEINGDYYCEVENE